MARATAGMLPGLPARRSTESFNRKRSAMTEDQAAAAFMTLLGAEDDSLSFPECCARLLAAGFERYSVDYARASRICYLPSGDSIEHEMHRVTAPMGTVFDVPAVKAAIAEAQANGPGYSYLGFSEKVVAAGCVGYLVSLPGQRAVYFGRAGEAHVEHFPQ